MEVRKRLNRIKPFCKNTGRCIRVAVRITR